MLKRDAKRHLYTSRVSDLKTPLDYSINTVNFVYKVVDVNIPYI